MAKERVIGTLWKLRDQVVTFTIRRSRAEDAPAVIAIWRAAVDATHHFLAAEDRDAIEGEVSEFLPQVPLWIAAGSADLPIAFMLLLQGHMEALFVHPAYFGVGVGSALVRHGRTLHGKLTTDVNEQNGQAVQFYKRMQFKQIGRSPIDGRGRPYALIHLAQCDGR